MPHPAPHTEPLPEPVKTANQTILDAIATSEGPVTMGLLPISKTDEETCLDATIGFCNGNLDQLLTLMRVSAPAAACYTVASCASQSVTEGRKFWEPLSGKLNLDLSRNKDRESLATVYRKTCKQLGVVTPDVSSMSWKNIAPMMAQASILHAWKDSLASGLKRTIKNTPVPDLEDRRSLARFSTCLAGHIHHLANLKNVLQTEVGGVVAHRLISSFVFNRYDLLPAHLKGPMRQAFRVSVSNVNLKSPHVSFSENFGEFELILPRQAGRLTTENTRWLVGTLSYPVHAKQRIPESEFPSDKLTVRLNNLDQGYPDQEFPVTLGLKEHSFRIFDQKTLREKTFGQNSPVTLPPGDYMVVMRPGVSTNDCEYEEHMGDYKVLPDVVLRPGSEPLLIDTGEKEFEIRPALKTGIYHADKNGNYLAAADGSLVHYNDTFHFQAYIPKDHHKGSIRIAVYSGDKLLGDEVAELRAESQGVYDYSDNLKDTLSACVAGLPPGIHPIRISISTSLSTATRSLWYWQGLKDVDDNRGFLCEAPPCNIDYSKSKGIIKSQKGCSFAKGYHAPEILITLRDGTELHIPRAGVQAVCYSPEDGWVEDLRAADTLPVTEKDRRIIKFQSGGFQSWSLQCNEKEFARLDRNRTRHSYALRSIVAAQGRAGQVTAVNERGERTTLFSYAYSLIASPLTQADQSGAGSRGKGWFSSFEEAFGSPVEKKEADAARPRSPALHRTKETWVTNIPSDDLGTLGVEVVDYTDSPRGKKHPVTELPTDLPGTGAAAETSVVKGVSVLASQLPEDHLTKRQIRLSLSVRHQSLKGKFLVISLLHREEQTEQWAPLHCMEKHNPSRLSIVISHPWAGNKTYSTWWNHLWRVAGSAPDTGAPLLYDKIPPSGILSALETISRLTSTKYPAPVRTQHALLLVDLPDRLLQRRAYHGHYDLDQWWDVACEELARHARARTTPVVRRFLMASSPRLLTHHWSRKPNESGNDPGNFIAAMGFLDRIKKTGGRTKYAQLYYHDGTVPEELFQSFSNWNTVLMGRDEHFRGFGFNTFFKHTLEKAGRHTGKYTGPDEAPLLSARHLLLAIRALNRRSRILQQSSDSDNPEHTLANKVHAVTSAHKQLEKQIYKINRMVGYQPENKITWRHSTQVSETIHYPDLPGIDNKQAKCLAELTWGLCVTARATAHGRTPAPDFRRIYHIFSGQQPDPPVHIVLTFAPELFAYYTALLDFALHSATTN